MDFRGRHAIFFITILCGVMNSEPAPPNLTPHPELEYLKLALQWSGAFRYPLRCPCNVSEDFYIHGLWEEPEATYCSTDPFMYPKDRHLIGKMKSMWPSIDGCDDTTFWEHEWKSHGHFSNLRQLDYFNKVIKLKEGVDPLRVLVQNKIYPSSCPYSIDRIKKALEKITGFAEISCWDNDVLQEIRFCVDRTASSFMECKEKTRESRARGGRCGSKIYFLPCDYNSERTPSTRGTTSRSTTRSGTSHPPS